MMHEEFFGDFPAMLADFSFPTVFCHKNIVFRWQNVLDISQNFSIISHTLRQKNLVGVLW